MNRVVQSVEPTVNVHLQPDIGQARYLWRDCNHEGPFFNLIRHRRQDVPLGVFQQLLNSAAQALGAMALLLWPTPRTTSAFHLVSTPDCRAASCAEATKLSPRASR